MGVLQLTDRRSDECLPLASTTANTGSHGRALATLDGTRESYRRRAIVAVQKIRDTLSLLKVGLGQRHQAAVMSRRAQERWELPPSEAP